MVGVTITINRLVVFFLKKILTGIIMMTLILSCVSCGSDNNKDKKDSKKLNSSSAAENVESDESADSENTGLNFGKNIKSEQEFQNNISLILGKWTTEEGETITISNGSYDENKVNDEHYRLDGGAAAIEMGYIENLYALRNFINFGDDFDFDRYSQMIIHYSSSLNFYRRCFDKDITDNYLLAIKVQWRMYPYIYVQSVSETQLVLVNQKNEKMVLTKGDDAKQENLGDFERKILDTAIEQINALQNDDIDKYIDLVNMDMIYQAHRNELYADGESLDLDELTSRVKESAYELEYDLSQYDLSGEPYDFEIGNAIGDYEVKEKSFSFSLGNCRLECTYYYMDDGSMDCVHIGWVEAQE